MRVILRWGSGRLKPRLNADATKPIFMGFHYLGTYQIGGQTFYNNRRTDKNVCPARADKNVCPP